MLMNDYLVKTRELGIPFSWSKLDDFERKSAAIMRRWEMVLEYAYAIPSEPALDLLVELAPIVEVGAGGGYWAMLLRERGVDVIAYDIAAGKLHSPTEGRDMRPRRLWTDVLRGEASRSGEHPDRTLFLCWPPYDTGMAYDALSAYLDAGGRTLVYIGEGNGGCTANESFFELLEQRMVEDHDHEAWIPQWPGIHDYLSVWRAT